jgi:uncharacterized protein YeeX (DUF496 family)
MPPKTIQEGDLNEDLDYKVKDNYELISLKDWNKLYIKISESGFIGLNVNSFDNSILLYNFVKTGSDDLYIYYSIIGYDGRLIKSEFKLLTEKAFDIYNDVKGFFGILQTGNIPTFFVDFASDKDRKINSYTLNSNEIITATTEYPLEIRGSNEHFIKSSKQIGSDPKIICLINEDKDKFSDTYGILSLEISKDFKSIDRKLKVWSKDEVNKLSNGDKLECNSISDILIKNGDIFLIIESNELEMVYEQSTYIPVSHLREALILRLNTALDTKWSHYIKDRDFKRIISCDNKCKYLVEPEKRFNLKFTDTNHNDKFSIYYGDNESEQFTRKVLDLNEGKVLSDDKLFEIDKLFFFYPQRMYFDENQIIMYLSVDCDSHIVKFKLPN